MDILAKISKHLKQFRPECTKLMIQEILIGIRRQFEHYINLYYQGLQEQVMDLIFSAFVRNINTSWMLELDICCVKDGELYV